MSDDMEDRRKRREVDGLDAIIGNRLDALYDITGEDWELRLHHSLTEPTCPTCVIGPEGWRISRYRVDCSGLAKSLETAVALVHAEVVERKVVGSYAPFSDPDDDAYAKWLYARAAGSNAKLPRPPAGDLPEEYEWILDGWLMKHEEGLRTGGFAKQGSAYQVGYIIGTLSHKIDARINDRKASALVRKKLKERRLIPRERSEAGLTKSPPSTAMREES